MDTQTGQRNARPVTYVEPDENQFGPAGANTVREAVERGGRGSLQRLRRPRRWCGSARPPVWRYPSRGRALGAVALRRRGEKPLLGQQLLVGGAFYAAFVVTTLVSIL